MLCYTKITTSFSPELMDTTNYDNSSDDEAEMDTDNSFVNNIVVLCRRREENAALLKKCRLEVQSSSALRCIRCMH